MIVLAVLGTRSVRSLVALISAVGGVSLLTEVRLAGEPTRVARATYALLVSLLPTTATIVGIMILGQVPTWIEVIGVSMVVGGVALRRERGFDGRARDVERS